MKLLIDMDIKNIIVSVLKDLERIIKNSLLITCASYNEQSGWMDRHEKDLLKFLSFLNAKEIKSVLSNVFRNKCKENSILVGWLKDKSYLINLMQFKLSYKR
jgi:hypothetical protein